MQQFTKNLIDIIQHIPEGTVMTYGQIAKVSGNPQAARQVARVLHTMSKKYHLPWHRVVNVQGKISIQDEELFQVQKLSLEGEGVVVDSRNRVDLQQYQHTPEL